MEMIGDTQPGEDASLSGVEDQEHARQVGGRIARLRGKRSQAVFARLTGTHVNSIGRYERGERLPDTDALRAISRATGADIDWILTGTGVAPDMASDAADPDSRAARQAAKDAEEEGVILVPMYGARPSAGTGSALEDYVEGWHEMTASEAKELGLRRKTTAMVRVRGDSMEPTLRDGERVVIDTSVTEITHDAIYVMRVDDTLVVKRAQLLRGGTVKVVSDNPRYEPYEVSPHDAMQLAVVGRAVHVWRKL